MLTIVYWLFVVGVLFFLFHLTHLFKSVILMQREDDRESKKAEKVEMTEPEKKEVYCEDKQIQTHLEEFTELSIWTIICAKSGVINYPLVALSNGTRGLQVGADVRSGTCTIQCKGVVYAGIPYTAITEVSH